MLDRIILIIHSRTDCTYITSHTVAKKFFQTVIIDDLCVIVQKQDILALRKGCAVVVDRGIVELSVPVNNMCFRVGCFQFLVICKGLIICTVVFHNDVFVVLIR